MSPAKLSFKVCITIVQIFLTSIILAQNYAPFNENVTKRFYDPTNPADNDYFFYADSVYNPTANTTVLQQYFALQSTYGNPNISGCGFWGPTTYLRDTTWLGVEIRYQSSTQNLNLVNSQGDTLNFDFSVMPGDSSVFFENISDRYFIKALQVQNEAIYSVSDIVKTFKILHFDGNNQMVNSTLNGKEIKLAANFGLISFFDTYHFPVVEKHLLLKGQLNPLIGTYQMRFEELYPFETGDSLQFNGYTSPTPCTYLRSYRVLDRQETADTVTITFNKSLVYTSSIVPQQSCPLALDVYPTVLKFPKNSDLLGYPYNRIARKKFPLSSNENAFYGFETRVEDSLNAMCGKRICYTGTREGIDYCDSCYCFGPFDPFQKDFPSKRYSEGHGINIIETFSPATPDPIRRNLTMVYSSIGGVVCGSYLQTGITEQTPEQILFYPSPANNELHFSGDLDQLKIFTVDGTVIQNTPHPSTPVYIVHFPAGVYILQLRKGNHVAYKRIIKQ